METEEGFVYTINGVRVIFPCKAYPTQLCMMDKIIKGVERQQNALLESPTGSGKSLALLCSCLAWQTAEYEKTAKMDKKLNDVVFDNGCCSTGSESGNEISLQLEHQEDAKVDHKMNVEIIHIDSEKPQETETCSTPLQTSVPNKSSSPTDEDFQPAKKRFRTPANQQAVRSIKRRRVQTPQGVCFDDEDDHDPPDWRMELTTDASRENASPGTTEGCDKFSASDDTKGKASSERIKIPKIYFGTRTHKQIAQITRELGKTQYKKARMTILSSREHSCVHRVVSRNKNKNEECKKLLDGSEGGTCRYYHKIHTISTQSSIRLQGLDKAWDIEDLVTLGNRVKACPYYGARELMKEADIIFCPYNYLIDPKIRMQMEINLKDQIVVLDEAHNVEDSARDAASLSITAVELQEVLDDLDKMISIGVLPEQHRSLHLLVASLLRWIDVSSSQLKERGFEQAYKVWAGIEIVAALGQQGITPATFFIHWEHFEFVLVSLKDPNRQKNSYSLSSQSISRLEGIFLVAKYMLENDMKHIADYRAAIMKTAVMVRNENLGGGWRRSHVGMRKEWTHSLNFWCLNPAVIFSELGSVARCIILTSGTLSPMASFSSELGIAFPIQLEANHVVGNSQVWVGTLSAGPSGSAINASYHSAETFAFQDEVGRMVLNVCETVPHGVLCFFPSYNMLDKLSKRWQTTGLWSQLVYRKIIVSEPRSGDKLEFDDIMHQFYHAVRVSEGEEPNDEDSDDESSVDGGLFLAVCRGKVSEGLDFADNNARAVITIGIPFPNVKDVQVELKRKYNNMHASSRGLLTGSEWYEIQAYRALNQALGRCIRHKQDWGAILLIDERFNKSPKYTNGISKWVRHRIKRFLGFGAAMSSLKEFASARRIEPCPAIPSPHTLSQQNTSTVSTPARHTSTATGMVDMKNSNIKAPVAPTPLHTPGGNTSVSVYHVCTPTPTLLDACDIASKTLCFNTEVEDSRDEPKHAPGQTDKRAMSGETLPSCSLSSDKLVEIPCSKLRDCDTETPADAMETAFSSSPVLFSTPCSSRSVSPAAVVGENTSCPPQETTQGRDNVDSCSVDDVKSVEITCVNSVKPDVSNKPITHVEESNHVTEVTTIRKLFKSGRPRVNEPVNDENGLGTLVDDVKENMNKGSFSRENCVETAVKEREKCLTEKNSHAEVQNSEGNSRIRRNSGIRKNEHAQRGNLRRSQRKNSRKNSTTHGNHAVYEKADEPDCSSVLFCSRCGCHLLTGHVSLEPVKASVLDLLCGSGSILNERAVLRADKESCEPSSNMCPLGHLRSDQTSAGFKLNSVYVSETECCYIPQVCRVCLTNGDSSVIGLDVVSFNANTVHSEAGDPRHFRTGKQVWLFENAVTCGKHNG